MNYTKLLLVFLVCSSNLVRGQTYQSVFGEDSTRWYVYHEVADAGFTFPKITIGDTLFNGLYYKFVYDNWNGEEAFLREDSTHSKLYYYSTFNQQEYLIMNLDWNEGDTVFPYNPNINSYTVIDSVYFNNGLKTLRTNVSLVQWPTVGTLEFIETIGPTGGINIPFAIPFGTLICAFKDEIQTFEFPDTNYDCNYYWVGIEKVTREDQFWIYPNPSDKEIFITLNGEPGLSRFFFISDLTGTIWQRGELTSSTNAISVEQLPSGAYFFLATNQQALIGRKFFIKL